MSRLFVEDFRGNLHEIVPMLNKLGARFVFSMYVENRPWMIETVTVVFKFDDYPAYQWWCEKLGREPISTAEFFE